MSYTKDTAPLERATPPAGGFFDKKRIIVLAAGVVGIGGLAAWGFSIRGEDATEIKVSDVQPARINAQDARPQNFQQTAQAEDPGQPQGDRQQQDTGSKGDGEKKRKGPPEGFRKTSPVVMRGSAGGAAAQGQQVAQAQAGGRGAAAGGQQAYQGGASYGATAYADGGGGYSDDMDGMGGRGGERSGGMNGKAAFYANGGASYARGLDIESELMPEAPGCVIKAGEQITLQTRKPVRTTLPQRILGYVVNPVEGNHYLGNGMVERCLAIRAGSTVLSEINANVDRGDLRIQACALRLDLLGGGRRVLDCQPAHGADGGAGIEAESDYAVAGIATGILIEAALASARGLGGLIAGPAGIAVQVGASGISDVGSEYVRRELMRPPVLTMEAGAIWGVQLNGDLSFPID